MSINIQDALMRLVLAARGTACLGFEIVKSSICAFLVKGISVSNAVGGLRDPCLGTYKNKPPSTRFYPLVYPYGTPWLSRLCVLHEGRA